MHLIAGLGNPGKKYEKTRHNLGFRVIDELYKRWSLPETHKRFEGQFVRGNTFGQPVMLLKPQTFMNLSGSSVTQAIRFFKIDAPTGLWVIHDDIDLPLGTLRIRENGSAGGHNGVKSIIDRLGSNDFIRFRIGVGRPAGKMAAEDYVLKPFGRSEVKLAKEMVVHTADAVETALKQDLTRTMNLFNK